MAGDLVRELRQFQRYAVGLHSVLAEAQARAPRQAEGQDRSGAVRVRLGADGLPEAIRVIPDWNRSLSPAAFGDAVLQAFASAAGARMAAWTRTLEEEGWQSKVDKLRSELDRPPGDPPAHTAATAGPPSGAVPPAFRRAPGNTGPRAIDVLAEDAMKALDAAQEQAGRPAPAPRGIGRAGGGRLVITLAGGGLVSCTADPRWVAQQTAARLMTALSEALAAARDQLARAEKAAGAAATAQQESLGPLFEEALALIKNPQQPPKP